MNWAFYPRLAWDGIRKNKQLFTPFILTCVGMVMMFYIIIYLATGDMMEGMVGYNTLQAIFELGSAVIGVFATIFLFYTHSFLLRKREKEFGLYHVLGMGKFNIAIIIFFETLFVAIIAISGGLIAGIAFSKLAELGMFKLMNWEVTYDLSISAYGIIVTVKFFGLIFIALLVLAIMRLYRKDSLTLLNSERTGEKPPKGNIILGLAGLGLLLWAYYTAWTIADPLTAIMVFFQAVLMVIFGTYLLMIATSVVFCKFLKKRKSYYYRPKHFVSVSSLTYRMKRNGAGLASICILSTMVLVIIASTTCLYFGEDDAINARYPRDIDLEFRFRNIADLSDEHIAALQDGIDGKLKDYEAYLNNAYAYRSISFFGYPKGEVYEVDINKIAINDVINTGVLFNFMPLADYNAMTGFNETLNDDEVIICTDIKDFKDDRIIFNNAETLKIKKQVADIEGLASSPMMNELRDCIVVVKDLNESIKDLLKAADFTYEGQKIMQLQYLYNFDTTLNDQKEAALYDSLRTDLLKEESKKSIGYYQIYTACKILEKEDFHCLYGSLFYLGIILSIVFMTATVLIIYYKQISEGYEDQSRFAIMEQIGMTKKEIRQSINSQLLTVFFFPLLLSCVHMFFAFPIILKILSAMHLNNASLFRTTTIITIAIFALLYIIVYRLTSNAYYKIVTTDRYA